MLGWPQSSEDPPPEMEDRGSLDGEDNHGLCLCLYQLLLYVEYFGRKDVKQNKDDDKHKWFNYFKSFPCGKFDWNIDKATTIKDTRVWRHLEIVIENTNIVLQNITFNY